GPLVGARLSSWRADHPWSPLRVQTPRGVRDALHDTFDVFEDRLVGHAENRPPEPGKRPVTRRIRLRTLFVVRPVALHDETHRRARKVDDPVPDDELTPEAEPGLGAREPPPEVLLRPRW